MNTQELRLAALQQASSDASKEGPTPSTAEVVKRAETYLSFLKGKEA